MTYDLGFKIGMTALEFSQHLQLIDKNFHLVMITEYFDESLILLAKLLCWDFKELTFEKLNEGYRRKPKLPSKAKAILKQLLSKEYELYDYFKSKFLKLLRQFGHQRMEEKKVKLVHVREMAVTKCQKRHHTVEFCPKRTMFDVKRLLEKMYERSNYACPCYPFNQKMDCISMSHGSVSLTQIAKCIQENYT